MNLLISVSTALAFCWWGQLPPHGEFERDWLAFLLLALVMLVLGLKAHLAQPDGNPPQPSVSLGRPLATFQLLWLTLALLLTVQFATLPPEVWGGRFVLTLGWMVATFGAIWAGALAAATHVDMPGAPWRAVAKGLLGAALFNALVAWVQILPWDALQNWVPAPVEAGRGYGALLQPNLTATLLVIGLASLDGLLRTAPDVHRYQAERTAARFAAIFLGSGVAVTGSRVGLVLLLIWSLGQIWRARQPRNPNAPGAWAVSFWWPLLGLGLALLAAHFKVLDVTTVADRGAALSNGRSLIFSHALDMGVAFPLGGAGFGQLSFWHAELPYHPKMPGYLTHAHNLVLQFWAELGALGVVWLTASLATLAWPIRRWFRQSSIVFSEDRWWAAMLLLMLLLHSMTEMPLWSAPFLLLFAFAAGLWLAPEAGTVSSPAVPVAGVVKLGTVAALLAVIACVATYRDYVKVSVLFDGSRWSDSNAQTAVEQAQTSWLFRPTAEFAAANSTQVNAQTAPAFARTLPMLWRYVTDPRMFDWQLRTSAWQKDAPAFTHHAQRFEWLYPEDYADFKATVASEQGQLPWTDFSPVWP